MTTTIIPPAHPPSAAPSSNPDPILPSSHRLRCPAPPVPATIRDAVETWGRSSVSPFNLGDGREFLGHPDLFGTGFLRRGRWAVMATDVAAAAGHEDESLSLTLDIVRDLGLRPTFVAVADPSPYQVRGMWTTPIADDPIIDLPAFSLVGKRRANIRHSVTSARRAGLRVVPWSDEFRVGVAAVSAAWLTTKKGGEMGFTLGRFDPDELDACDCRVALDAYDQVVGFVTWHHFDNHRGRVLDLMRRLPEAPNPTVDLLIADSLLEFAAAGVEVASLGCVPRSHGSVAERLYPTRSLHRYKAKFDPRWQVRHLVAPSRRELPGALLAVAKSYVQGGFLRALRHNG